ncbi:MAG: hypothetical protein KDD42_01950 [Bdellovibrionales bacterium]|nr:hypothetical protein [Bdellovibrionales bacterium]
MINLRQQLLEHHHQELAIIMRKAGKMLGLHEKDRNTLKNALQKLLDSNEAAKTSSIIPLAKAIDERLDFVATVKNPEQDNFSERVRRECEEIRIQLVVSAMGASRAQGLACDASADYGETRFALRSLICGIHYAKIEDKLVILLPEISNEDSSSRALAGLEEIVEFERYRSDWVVDFSQVDTMPGIFLANVIFHQDRLRMAGYNLYVSWLRQEAFSAQQTATLEKVLNLVAIGGFLFSR